MKQISLFLALAFVLSACPTYDSFPEPELEVEYVEFASARYTAANRSIVLTYQTPVAYEGIYSFYNRSEGLNMARYLKNSDIGIEKASETKTGITIVLTEGSTPPLELAFDTSTPWYFYTYRNYNFIIEAKAFIKTETLPVN